MSLKEREYPWVNTASELPLRKQTKTCEKFSFGFDITQIWLSLFDLSTSFDRTSYIVELKNKIQSKGLHILWAVISVRQVKARQD